MQRWIGLALVAFLCVWMQGCKIEGPGAGGADSSTLPERFDAPLPDTDSPAEPAETESEETVEAEAPGGEAANVGEPVEAGDRPVEAEDDAAMATEDAGEAGDETSDDGEEAEPEESANDEPESDVADAGPGGRDAASPTGSPAAEPEPTPGVGMQGVQANATLLDRHLTKCAKLLDEGKFESAKRAVNDAQRAFSYLDVQRPASILSQALDLVEAKAQEANATGARRALRFAEDYLAEAEVAAGTAEAIEELADDLRDREFEAALETTAEIRGQLRKSGETEERVLNAVRVGLVQAQFAIERHAPLVAAAEVKDARTHLKKLIAPPDEE